MTRERWIRLIAGTFIMLSLALAVWVSHWWLLFTAFVGLNLFQSALTRWCLMDDILRVIFKVPGEADRTPAPPPKLSRRLPRAAR